MRRRRANAIATTLITLNALIFPVLGTCGPMHRSSQFLSFSPVTYQLRSAEPAALARCALSTLYLLPSFAVDRALRRNRAHNE